MNKREAIAALRELADKLEAMPIDGEALAITASVNIRLQDAIEFAFLKVLVNDAGLGLSFGDMQFLNPDVSRINKDVMVFIIAPKGIICP